MEAAPNPIFEKDQLERERLAIVRNASLLTREVLSERILQISACGTSETSGLFVATARRCLVTHKAIWELAKPDYIAEANILLRPLSEGAINACYLQVAPPLEVANFVHFDKIAIHRQNSKFEAIGNLKKSRAIENAHSGMKRESDEAQILSGRTQKSLGWTDTSVYDRAKAVDRWFLSMKVPTKSFVTFARSVYDAAHPFTHYTASTLRYANPDVQSKLFSTWDLRLTLVAAQLCLENLSMFAGVFFDLPEDERISRATELTNSAMDEH
jgi:hypothetical protein